MTRALRLVARLLVCACLLLTTATPAPHKTTTPAGEDPVTGMYPEVRLRKLHLVRPDLIPYPIAYEVCC
jgi:hypothetical protein